MSFRFADLKKTVRKGRDGYTVAPARLEGRKAEFQIEFALREFETGLGKPRRELDPDLLLDFVGDARLGRGLLATLAQWYRMRARTFAEVLDAAYPADRWRSRLAEHGIAGPVELRAWLYAHVNRGGTGFLDPDDDPLFWGRAARALGIRRDYLCRLLVLDRPDEAVLVRCSPRPSAADVMTAYNARAHTSLLRGCEELALRCAGPHASIERTVRTWTDALGVEASVEGDTACLRGQTDALGSWSRHGRKLERITLELLADREVDAREARGRLTVGERECAFTWSRETLAGLGAGLGSTRGESLPARIDALALRLRAEREREGLTGWRIGRPGHLVGAAGAVFLSHLELRQGDRSLYVRLAPESPEASALEALERFRGKTAVALLEWPSGEAPPVLHLPGQAGEALAPDTLLAALGERLLGAPPARVTPAGRPALLAA